MTISEFIRTFQKAMEGLDPNSAEVYFDFVRVKSVTNNGKDIIMTDTEEKKSDGINN